MSAAEDQDTTIYRVVMNHEEQYSIWPDWKEIPAGWREPGAPGTKDECLAYIKGRVDRHAPAELASAHGCRGGRQTARSTAIVIAPAARDPWFSVPIPKPAARLRLFCFVRRRRRVRLLRVVARCAIGDRSPGRSRPAVKTACAKRPAPISTPS